MWQSLVWLKKLGQTVKSAPLYFVENLGFGFASEPGLPFAVLP